MKTEKIIIEVLQALEYAEQKHPIFPTNEFEQLSVISEEMGEVHNAVLEAKENNAPRDNIRHELVQLAAVVIRKLKHFENEAKTSIEIENLKP